MPAPTKTYKIIIGTDPYSPDVTEVNELASQGWDLVSMAQLGGGAAPGRFWYLMSHTVTAKAEEKKDA